MPFKVHAIEKPIDKECERSILAKADAHVKGHPSPHSIGGIFSPSLPLDIMHQLLWLLGPLELAQLGSTCSYMFKMCCTNALWKPIWSKLRDDWKDDEYPRLRLELTNGHGFYTETQKACRQKWEQDKQDKEALAERFERDGEASSWKYWHDRFCFNENRSTRRNRQKLIQCHRNYTSFRVTVHADPTKGGEVCKALQRSVFQVPVSWWSDPDHQIRSLHMRDDHGFEFALFDNKPTYGASDTGVTTKPVVFNQMQEVPLSMFHLEFLMTVIEDALHVPPMRAWQDTKLEEQWGGRWIFLSNVNECSRGVLVELSPQIRRIVYS